MKVRKLHSPKRVFIGVRLREELADDFTGLQSSLGGLPGRPIPSEDIHLTLVPPFETRDLPFTKGTLHTALQETRQFKLRFLRLDYGPDKRKPALAWVECGATKELVSLKRRLLKAFDLKEKVPFIPHMTVARFKKADVEKLARNPIKQPVRFSMDVESVELFESPNQGGSGYTVLQSVQLQPKGG